MTEKDTNYVDESVNELEQPLIDRGWPPALAKATNDPFLYAVGLRTGQVILFEEARDVGNGFVVLLRVDRDRWAPGSMFTFDFSRGLELRVADVVWALDAPFGS